MQGKDICRQLQKIIPRITSGFSESVGLVSISPAGTTATATTSAPHGLVDGKVVSIIGALAPVQIDASSFLRTISTAQFKTLQDHDLTLSERDKARGGKTISISGATESEFNGTFQLLRVLNRRELVIAVTDSGPTTISGDPIVDDANGSIFNGVVPVSNTTETTFDYELPVAYFVDAEVSAASVQISMRMGHVLSVDRYIADIYTKKPTGSDELLVVLGDASISKRRDEQTDAVSSSTGEYSYTPILIQPFAVYVVQNATKDLGGGSLRDKIETEYRPAIYQAIVRAKFDTGFISNGHQATPTGDGVFIFGSPAANGPAVYVHEFTFEQLTQLCKADMADTENSVALRDIEYTLTTDLGTGEMTAGVDLDEEPIA